MRGPVEEIVGNAPLLGGGLDGGGVGFGVGFGVGLVDGAVGDVGFVVLLLLLFFLAVLFFVSVFFRSLSFGVTSPGFLSVSSGLRLTILSSSLLPVYIYFVAPCVQATYAPPTTAIVIIVPIERRSIFIFRLTAMMFIIQPYNTTALPYR